MAQVYFKMNLKQATLPMLSEEQTRTIIGSGGYASAGKESASPERPGIAYMHNVMPSEYGLDTVGFTSQIPSPDYPAFVEDVDDTRIIYGDEASRIYMTWDLVGNMYALLPGSSVWLAIPDPGYGIRRKDFTANSVTIGTVNGVSYINFSYKQTFIYNEATNALLPVELKGLIITEVLGIAASSGYLVTYTTNAINWSSTLDPTDFVASQVTGAGNANVAGTEGDIVFILSNSLGLLVYTFANVVAGTYTGNILYPWKFRPVNDSKGGITLDRVAYEANSKDQFAYTKAGLQAVTSIGATNILPDVTDFLSGKRFEDFNTETNTYVTKDLSETQTMLKKIKYIASRYLVISYGLPKGLVFEGKATTGYFTHALIYDTALKREGKLKIEHVDVFEYVGEQTEIAKETVAFLLPDGEVKTLHSSTLLASNGVLILGKLQEVRERMIQLLSVEVENIPLESEVGCIDMASLKGKQDYILHQGYIADKSSNLVIYDFRNTAKNHNLLFKGRFNLVTVQVKYAVHGRR
jgi:hypothetical protein